MKGYLYAALALFIGVQAFRFASKTRKLEETKTKLATTESALSDTISAHADTRRLYGALKDYSGKQEIKLANLGTENANLKAANDRADRDVYRSQLAQREKDRLLIEANARLSRAEKQALLARLQQGGMSTDSLTTILNLQAQLIDRDSAVIPNLNRRLSKANEQISKLEIEVNNDRKAQIAAQGELVQVRTFVADERAKAKGIFARKRNRTLGEVEKRLGQSQQRINERK